MPCPSPQCRPKTPSPKWAPSSWDDREQKFYAMPQPAMPPKDTIPEMGPLEYAGLQT